MQSKDQDQAQSRWHVDRGIPIAVIVGLLLQFIGFVFWVGNVSRQVSDQERRLIVLEAQKVGERLAAVEVMVAETRARVLDMNRNVEMMVQRQISNHAAQR